MTTGIHETLQRYPTFDIHDLTEFDTGEKLFRLANIMFAPLSHFYLAAKESGITDQVAADLADGLFTTLADLTEEEDKKLTEYLDSRITFWTEHWLDRIDFGPEPEA